VHVRMMGGLVCQAAHTSRSTMGRLVMSIGPGLEACLQRPHPIGQEKAHDWSLRRIHENPGRQGSAVEMTQGQCAAHLSHRGGRSKQLLA
jgi:hypothetical protein